MSCFREEDELHSRKGFPFVAVVLAILLLSPRNAWAYVDPGTASYVFQVAIAAALAGIYSIRRYSAELLAFFRSLFGKTTRQETDRQ